MPGSVRLIILACLSSIISFIRFTLPGGEWLWKKLDMTCLLMIDVWRLFAGRFTANGIEKCERPKKPLIVYEFEGCPYCRKVRETLSVLDIDHYVYPCPRETLKVAGHCLNSRFRPEVAKLGGLLKFPFLIDPNTDRKMYESDEIIKYLWNTYGSKATPPLNYRIAHWKPYRDISMKMCQLLRPCTDMGILRAPSHRPKETIDLWGYESSPCTRRVREVLSMLELPYLYHEMPGGSTEKRQEFIKQYADRFSQKDFRKKFGMVQVPFLRDSNSNVEMFESSDIAKYLCQHYQTAAVPNECWCEYGSGEGKKMD